MKAAGRWYYTKPRYVCSRHDSLS
jgi:TFIIF-interacting CTD phosphatase-like protein